MSLTRPHRTRPRHAVESDWRRSGRRISRRALLIAAVSLTAGPLAYLLLPVPSAAEPGWITAAPAPVVASVPASPPGLVGRLIDTDDLITDPVGVVVATPDARADGELIGWPVSVHTPTTGFGYRSDPFTHKQRWHDGVDLGQACGDPVWASLDGTVAYAGWGGGYGNRVILRHADRNGHRFETTYNHMSKIDVQVGQAVQRGFVIGRVGTTGRSTGCHMHFEVILDGSYVDPMRFLTGDQSKAHLSRRVGDYMPVGLPSPGASETTAPTKSNSPKPTRTPSATASPSPSTTTPSSSATPTPSPSTPVPSSPTPSAPTPSPLPPSTPLPASPSPPPTSTASPPSATTQVSESESATVSSSAETPGAQTPDGSPS